VRILHVGYGFRPLRQGGVILYAEDLMREQVASGHQVAYFFPGRHNPLGRRNRLHRWSRDGVAMRELLTSTLIWGGTGTVTPHADLNHPPSEAAFEEVLEELRPDLIHIHELVGLPSSLIDVAGARAVPVVATLQDYLPLCPIIKLHDVDGHRCMRREPGAQCRRCCVWAPDGPRWMVAQTVRHELRERLPGGWARRALAGLDRGWAATQQARAKLTRAAPPEFDPDEGPPWTPPARSYQARRDINLERLSRLAALIVQSRRAREIYTTLGVAEETVRVLQLTLSHLDGIRAKEIATPPGRVRFVTLSGCASVEKGAEAVLGALDQLSRAGLAHRFELAVYGWVAEETRRRLARFPNVRIEGDYDPDQLNELLEDFDVGVVPSIWEESYGYVGVELLAKGIPVIGSARGGIVDYTRDGETGWVNEDPSASGLASIMAGIIARPEQISELNAAIRRERARIIKPFADHAREIEGIYRDVLAQAAAREDALAARVLAERQAPSAAPDTSVR
jgi:glycosyltransferase involved in cell wall biosynthesis